MRQLSKDQQHAGRGHQKVTDAQVQGYMTRFDAGEKLKDLAEEAGVSAPSLSTRIKSLRAGAAREIPPEPHKDTNLVETLRDRVDELEEEVRRLNQSLRAAVEPHTHAPQAAPRRDEIIKVLDKGELLTYAEIASRANTTATRVRSCVAKMGELVQKFHGEDGKAYVRTKKRRE